MNDVHTGSVPLCTLFWHFYHDSAAIVIVGVDSQFAAQVFGMSAGQW